MLRRVSDNISYIEDVRLRNQDEGRKMIKKLAKTFIGDSLETSSNADQGGNLTQVVLVKV